MGRILGRHRGVGEIDLQTPADALIEPFVLAYDGRDADKHVIAADQLGESIAGAARFYTAVAHYSAFGFVPRGRYKKAFRCYVSPIREGSIEQLAFLAPAVGDISLMATVYKEVISVTFKAVVGSLTRVLTKPSEMQNTVDRLVETIQQQGAATAAMNEHLVSIIDKQNARLADLHSKLIDTMPQLVEAVRPAAEAMVAPVGDTCSALTQFKRTTQQVVIDEADAEVIRSKAPDEVDDIATFSVNRVLELNLNSGHCVVELAGHGGIVSGKITDPKLSLPNNPYTTAMDAHTALAVNAKAVRRASAIRRLFISDTAGE